MKRERKSRSTFAQNLMKARKANGWTQHKAADMLNIDRKSYGAYEEGRAYPMAADLPNIAHVFGIVNLLSFMENPSFSYQEQDMAFTVKFVSGLDKKYAEAQERERKIVDLALGIGNDLVTC